MPEMPCSGCGKEDFAPRRLSLDFLRTGDYNETIKYRERCMTMSDSFGADYLSLTDEEGNTFELELLDTIEFEGGTYSVFLPADIDTMSTDDPDYGFIILKCIEEDGEELYGSVDDEEELERVFEYYNELLDAEEDPDGEDEE